MPLFEKQTPCALLKQFSFERKTSRNFCHFANETAKTFACTISYFYQRGKLAKSLNKEVGLQSLAEYREAQV